MYFTKYSEPLPHPKLKITYKKVVKLMIYVLFFIIYQFYARWIIFWKEWFELHVNYCYTALKETYYFHPTPFNVALQYRTLLSSVHTNLGKKSVSLLYTFYTSCDEHKQYAYKSKTWTIN
jgi:hypothetical protein